MRVRLIAVIGTGVCNREEADIAYAVGKLLAERGFGVICGGLGGVMEAVCRGVDDASGLSVGLLPGHRAADANAHVDVAIPTGLGEQRNPLVVRGGEAVIAIGGEYGTLSEIGFALKTGKRVVGLGTWELHRRGAIDTGILIASTPEEAVQLATESLETIAQD